MNNQTNQNKPKPLPVSARSAEQSSRPQDIMPVTVVLDASKRPSDDAPALDLGDTLLEGGTERYKIGDSFRDDAGVLWTVKRCQFGACGDVFHTKHGGARYCSPKHRTYAWRKRKKLADKGE